jgi:hypothetical protein
VEEIIITFGDVYEYIQPGGKLDQRVAGWQNFSVGRGLVGEATGAIKSGTVCIYRIARDIEFASEERS